MNNHRNNEYYTDHTAGEAVDRVRFEERYAEEANRALIQSFRNLAKLAGFEIEGRITLVHKKTGRKFR